MRNVKHFMLVAIMLLVFGCKKDFLDKKPSTTILQPTRLEEFQSLLDNYDAMNITAGLAVLSADDHVFYSDDIWLSSRTATERNLYIWSQDLFEGEASDDWNKPYTTIFYANNVLEGLEKMKVTSMNQDQWKILKGWACFARAFAYYELLSNFSKPFDPANAADDLGVPHRVDPSVDINLARSTVAENYDLVFSDLLQATNLLNLLPSSQRNRPSKVSVYALLSRIHLNRREYTQAELYADSCLMNWDKLIDYNTLNKTSSTPFGISNNELIYSKSSLNRLASSIGNTYIKIAPELISLYHPNDLRLIIYFNKQADGSYRMKRGYHGFGAYPFVGLATDEVLLIKAECLARKGQFLQAMDWLNRLLIKRWNTSSGATYVPLVALDAEDALNKVLIERRKELVWRGTRWDDLKRLNKEGRNLILERSVQGINYRLLPNSNRYVFPIPDNEIAFSGLRQNER